jgi:hypothetical protein
MRAIRLYERSLWQEKKLILKETIKIRIRKI